MKLLVAFVEWAALPAGFVLLWRICGAFARSWRLDVVQAEKEATAEGAALDG